MLTIDEVQKRIEVFLAKQMLEALRAVEYELTSFDAVPVELAAVARSQVELVRGAADATYLVQAFDDELLMQLQLNVHRLLVVYRVPALDALDAATLAVRLERWRLRRRACRLEVWPAHAPIAGDVKGHYVETYCYAFAGTNFRRRRAAAALLAYRHRADDAVLHARGGQVRHSPVAAPVCRFPGLEDQPAAVKAESDARAPRCRSLFSSIFRTDRRVHGLGY